MLNTEEAAKIADAITLEIIRSAPQYQLFPMNLFGGTEQEARDSADRVAAFRQQLVLQLSQQPA